MMTREEANKHLYDDWYIENGRLCVDGDKKDAFLEAVGMGITALRPVSRERVERALISLGTEELEKILEEQGGCELTCQFCDKVHTFTAQELQTLIDGIKDAKKQQ